MSAHVSPHFSSVVLFLHSFHIRFGRTRFVFQYWCNVDAIACVGCANFCANFCVCCAYGRHRIFIRNLNCWCTLFFCALFVYYTDVYWCIWISVVFVYSAIMSMSLCYADGNTEDLWNGWRFRQKWTFGWPKWWWCVPRGIWYGKYRIVIRR